MCWFKKLQLVSSTLQRREYGQDFDSRKREILENWGWLILEWFSAGGTFHPTPKIHWIYSETNEIIEFKGITRHHLSARRFIAFNSKTRITRLLQGEVKYESNANFDDERGQVPFSENSLRFCFDAHYQILSNYLLLNDKRRPYNRPNFCFT